MFSTRLRQHGFTLLEILVTLAIVAIVAALAVPSMSGVLGKSELSATSNRLVYSLQSARSEAIKRVTPVSLCPSADPDAADPVCGGTYTQGWIVFVDVNGNGARNGAADEIILRNEPLSPAFSVVPDALVSGGVLFNISGVSTNVAGVPISGGLRVSHAADDEERRVRIAASGRVSATSYNNVKTEDGAS